jgi:uncharacterized protein YrzB (UPF0473 family)
VLPIIYLIFFVEKKKCYNIGEFSKDGGVMEENTLESLSDYEVFELKDENDKSRFFTKIDEFTNESFFYWACEEVILNKTKDIIVDFGEIVILKVDETEEHYVFSQVESKELEKIKDYWYNRVKNYTI